MRFLRVLAPVLCILLPLSAVETQVWEHSEAADFEKGTLHKLSLYKRRAALLRRR